MNQSKSASPFAVHHSSFRSKQTLGHPLRHRHALAEGRVALPVDAQNAAVDQFETKIRPVLVSRCYPCHSKSAPTPQGGLLLDSTQGIRRGGNDGRVIQPGDPEHSLLIRAIRRTDFRLPISVT